MQYYDEIGHVYHSINSYIRDRYESLVGRLDLDMYLADIKSSSEAVMEVLPWIFAIKGGNGKQLSASIELDTYIAKAFYFYAIEGIPKFAMSFENGEFRECAEEELVQRDFGFELQLFLAYNEFFNCLEESFGGGQRAISMILVLNQFVARCKLDYSIYTGKETYLSIAEVALLAGMKEKSVRNIAAKEMGATYLEAREKTLIESSRALEWLKGRRKFFQSKLLETTSAKKYFCEIVFDRFNN